MNDATLIYDDDKNSLRTLFGITDSPTTWRKIKDSTVTVHNTVPVWIIDAEAAAADIAAGNEPSQTSALCMTRGGSFVLPIFARYELYRSDAKRCYIVFIQTRDRRFDLSQKTSLLICGLVLTVRFRQRVLPILDDIRTALARKSESSKKMELLTKFKKEVINAEVESAEFGLSPPRDPRDDAPLLNAFREGDTKDKLRALIADWFATRDQVFLKIDDAASPAKALAPSDAANEVLELFSSLRETNDLFIAAMCEELLFVEKVRSAVATSAP